MGRPTAAIVLNPAERETLHAPSRRRKTAQALALRARIVLHCAAGLDSKVVPRRLSITPQSVPKWRNRFAQWRMDGLVAAPRSGAPRTSEDAMVEAVISKTLETTPG
jgi:transposase